MKVPVVLSYLKGNEIEDGRFLEILVYNDKMGSMKKESFYSVDEANLRYTLKILL